MKTSPLLWQVPNSPRSQNTEEKRVVSEIPQEQHSRYEQDPQPPPGRSQQRSPRFCTPPLGLWQLFTTFSSQRGSTRAHVALWHLPFWHQLLSAQSSSADTHLLWLQGSDGAQNN